MAVVTTGYEVFVNSAWKTASKVPAKSPFGVDLVYGENAFETLDAAIAYLNEHPELADPILYIGDKKVTFSDSAGIFKSINSQEIKGHLHRHGQHRRLRRADTDGFAGFGDGRGLQESHDQRRLRNLHRAGRREQGRSRL